MIIIGITGGVGAGKSTVMNRLRDGHGAYTIQADKVGHELMKPGNVCYQPIIDIFGEEILNEDGTINRKKLGSIVFSKPRALKKLNKIIHPAVKESIFQQIEKQRQDGCPLLAMEAALLLEEHYDEICDDLWYIYVEDSVRRKRLAQERGYSQEKITSILNNQLEDSVFRDRCDCIIENNGDLRETYRQIDKRITEYGIM